MCCEESNKKKTEYYVFGVAMFHLKQAYHVEIPNKSWKFDE